MQRRKSTSFKISINRENIVLFFSSSLKGVTIPSQLRYIEYYADFVGKKRTYKKYELILKSVKINLGNQNNEELSKCKNIRT